MDVRSDLIAWANERAQNKSSRDLWRRLLRKWVSSPDCRELAELVDQPENKRDESVLALVAAVYDATGPDTPIDPWASMPDDRAGWAYAALRAVATSGLSGAAAAYVVRRLPVLSSLFAVVSPQMAEIHQLAKDAWQAASALWSYVTILVPRDPEKKTRPAREVAWRANVLRSKAAEAGAALATAPIYLAAVANGDDAHTKAIEYAAHVLSAIPAGGEAYHGKRLDTDEMVQDFQKAPYTEESIAGVWDELLAGFAAVAPPDETLLAKMESQIAKAEVKQRQTPQGEAAASGKKWQIVRDELDDIRLAGEHWTSYEKMARRLASTKRTVHMAVQNGTVELQDWARSQKGTKSSRKLVGQGVAEIVLNNAADTRGGNPAEDLEQEDIDRALTRLIDEAQPAERARIQQMDRAGKLKLAQLFYEQQMDE